MAHFNNDNDLAPFRGGFFLPFFAKSTHKIHTTLKVPAVSRCGTAAPHHSPMPRRKQDSTVGGIDHKKLAKTLIRARAERARRGGDDLERQAAALVEQLRDAHIGARQRAAGRKGRGERRETYAGKPIPSRKELRDAVEAMHDKKKHPTWSFNRVCLRVAKDFGYDSAWSVKKACKWRPAINWPDPRRRQK